MFEGKIFSGHRLDEVKAPEATLNELLIKCTLR